MTRALSLLVPFALKAQQGPWTELSAASPIHHAYTFPVTTMSTSSRCAQCTSTSSKMTFVARQQQQQIISLQQQPLFQLRGGSQLRGGGGGGDGVGAGVEGYDTMSAALENLDMNRVRIRLEGLSAYTVVSTLLLNASLRLFSSTPKDLKKQKRTTTTTSDDNIASSSGSETSTHVTAENIVKIVFCGSIVVSIMAGVYTTVVFSLLGLYSKTALGLSKDLAYLELMEATKNVRQYAFDSFLLSLISFQCAFVTSLFLTYQSKLRWWASILSLFAVLVSLWHWGEILIVAKRVLFDG